MEKVKMRTLILFCVVLSSLGFTESYASAQTQEFPFTSGNTFLRLCSGVEKEQRTTAETEHGAGCLLYIGGFVEGVETGHTATKVQTKREDLPMPFCRPDNVENAQLVRIVLKYIRENPEDSHQPTALVALWAFQKAFPCSGS